MDKYGIDRCNMTNKYKYHVHKVLTGSKFRLQVTYVVSSGLLVAFPVLVVAFVGDPAAASDHPDLITD